MDEIQNTAPPEASPAAPEAAPEKKAKRKPSFFANVTKRLAEEPATVVLATIRTESREDLKKQLSAPEIVDVLLVVRGHELKTSTQKRVVLS